GPRTDSGAAGLGRARLALPPGGARAGAGLSGAGSRMSSAPHPAQPFPAAAPDSVPARPAQGAVPQALTRPRRAWALAGAAWRLYMGHRRTFLLPVLLFEV